MQGIDAVGKTVWIVGKIIKKQVYVTRDGVNIYSLRVEI
jgi:hypothetical protein